ncbi:glycoside hydrolase family protein [Yersinia vastinensis]|uniref:glycoside hydrolase family protein n=1 Tax=Yersinia vastinensis TaxID=2890318 RepID=UPI0011A1FBD8|nr:glycoside hydrolase family protein [Yersinia vastinensis]
MSAKLPQFSYPVPSNMNGHAFSTAEDLLSKLDGESSGQYLVGSQGMWHGGIHITDATIPWCALSTNSDAEQQYRREPYIGEQFIRCMADGEIVAWRMCQDYESTAIPWRDESLHFSTSFVLVKHYIQPGDTDNSGLTFYTLYMNLAPFAAYAEQGGDRDRKNAGSQRYYTSAEDVLAPNGGNAAGTLAKDTPLTLGDSIITRGSDRRQFTEVTIAEETKNTAGTTLSVGTKIWTVSDRGSLKAAPSVAVPSWWAKCTPAYDTQPAGKVSCTSRTDWSYYLSREDVLQTKAIGRLSAGFPLSYEPDNTAQQVSRPVAVAAGAPPTDAVNIFSLVTLGRDVGKQKKGDRVWVVSDGDSLTPVTPTASASEPVFGEVVNPPTAIAIKAGDSIGHMGFFQLPEENGKRSRYQVHIECFSMDDKLPTFLTNPEHVGEQHPAFLKYSKAAPLLTKDAQGQMVDSTRKTLASGIVTLSKVPVVEVNGQPAYYQIHKENGYLAANSVKTLSQYALGELGFVTLDKASASFNLLDGVEQPDNVVKGILEQMHKAAQDETRTSHTLNEYNYQRLLERIDSNHDGQYSEQEYLQAVHNTSYRDQRYRIIAKHGSEWYYGKDDPLWKTYLDTLTTDAPLWKTYTEAFIEKIKWMEKVTGLGPNPWHMHPVVFLSSLNQKKSKSIIFPLKVKPKNDINGVWKNYYWAAALTDRNASQAIFGRNRSNGTRKHAARDLYTEPLIEVVAICNGQVKSISHYYYGTWQITMEHETDDGRRFFVRYGEVDYNSILVRVGDNVRQGATLAKTGLMINPNTGQHPNIISGQTVYMLHFEYYSGGDTTFPPNNTSDIPYSRRGDLHDPLEILQEGYRNTFEQDLVTRDRIDIANLNISEEGKAFIKEWEGFRANAYNDSKGFCTIGYGHLIEMQSCESIELTDEFSNGITRLRADELFESRLSSYVNGVKNSVTVPLYQHEFDALVCLLFNIGANGLNVKTPMLTRKVNLADYSGAAQEFLDITNDGDSGLVLRRGSERNLFLNNIYDASH